MKNTTAARRFPFAFLLPVFLLLSATGARAGRNSGGLPAGSSIKVLWLGNSLTGATQTMGPSVGWTPMPGRLVPLLAELGITMTYDSNILGGSEYSTHEGNSTSMAKIVDPSFDAVNLQATFQGDNDATARYNAVLTLFTAAHNAGSAVILEGIWSIPGGPQASQETNAIEGAAAQLNANFGAPYAFSAQVSKCWGVIETSSPTLMAKMHYDGTHQSDLGEYFNTLVYARFFSGRAVAGTTYVHPLAASVSTAEERQYMKQVVDSYVDYFYDAGTPPTASLTVSLPTSGQVIPAGQAVSYQAAATDSSSGDLSASIQWVDGGGAVIHTGSSFTQTLPAGSYGVTARVTGSDGKQASATRNYTVAGSVNLPPTATTAAQIVNYNTPFMQINLGGFASDPDGTLDWTTLQLDASLYHGVSLQQDSHTLSTANVNYQGTNFNGIDHFSWRVQDNDGAWSNWAAADLTVGDVLPPALPKGLRLR